MADASRQHEHLSGRQEVRSVLEPYYFSNDSSAHRHGRKAACDAREWRIAAIGPRSREVCDTKARV
jgi:hypothetical protein